MGVLGTTAAVLVEGFYTVTVCSSTLIGFYMPRAGLIESSESESETTGSWTDTFYATGIWRFTGTTFLFTIWTIYI